MTNENTEFDLEWAKRGGVIKAQHYACNGDGIFYVKQVTDGFFAYAKNNYDGNELFEESNEWAIEHMATRAECEAAGVEYIERPVNSDELTELRKDKDRLEFVFESGLSIKHSEKSGYWFSNTGIVYACDIYPNPRGAIDAVMKGGV